MNLSPSLDLIWRFAASEMAAGQFKEIEPEHFCMALLKFAEIPATAGEADDDHAEIAQVIAAEAELVREALGKCGIESTRARRKLRGQVGKGGVPSQAGQIHRSIASRALFECAAKLAQESDSDIITPLHLLTALVQSPTTAIAQAVLGMPLPPLPLPALPLLDKQGRDLLKEAAAGKFNAGSTAEAQTKAVLQVLARKDRKSVLLVSDNNDFTTGLANAVALAMAAKESPAELKRRRLIDVSDPPQKNMQVSPERDAKELERLRPLLIEAESHSEVILFVPAVAVNAASERGGQWTNLLRDALTKGKVQFICRVAPTLFDEHLRKDSVWKHRAEAVWLDKVTGGSIPREL